MPVWSRSLLVDTGPLIALGKVRDAEHKRAMKFIASFAGLFITTMPVVAEARHFLECGKIGLFEKIQAGAMLIEVIVEPIAPTPTKGRDVFRPA